MINKHIKVTIPRIVCKKESMHISIDKEIIENGDDVILRIDAYPHIAPKHMKRHFGYVDIPITKIINNNNRLIVNNKIIEIGGEPYTFNLPFWENGGVIWHMSLWHDGKILPYPVVSEKFYWFDSEDITPTLKIGIVTTSEQCNLRCVMCARQMLPHEHPLLSSRFMLKQSEARNIINEFRNLRSILLLGNGEPLLNKNIIEIIRIFREGMGDDAEINLGTNGTLLKPALSEQILDAGLSGMGISIDGATAETYEAIRVGANFEKLTDNLGKFTALLHKKNSSVHIWANYVVQPTNIRECGKFVELCASLGINDVRFSLMQDPNEKSPERKENSIRNLYQYYEGGMDEAKELLETARQEVMQRANELGIQCSLDNFRNETDEADDSINLFCPFIEYMGLSTDTRTLDHLCCNGAFRPERTNDADDPYREIRIELMKGNFSGTCSSCHMRTRL